MTKTLRMPGLGSRPLAATAPSAVASTAAVATRSVQTEGTSTAGSERQRICFRSATRS